MTDESCEIRLKNAEGVPVLQVCGTITKSALKIVQSTLDRLARAGHYNIILNLERAEASNWGFLSALAGTARRIRSHYGTIDLVTTQERVKHLLKSEPVARLFRLCLSDSQAVFRIKRLNRQPDALSDTSARLSERI